MEFDKASKVIDAILQAGPAPLLKSNGFRKKARVFWRTDKVVIQAVRFEASRFSDQDFTDFTISLSLSTAVFHQIWSGQPLPKNPGSATPCIEFGIDRLVPGITGCWEVTRKDDQRDVDALSDEICRHLEQSVLPYFTSINGVESLLQEVRQHSDRCIAIGGWRAVVEAMLLYNLGRVDQASQIMQRLWQRAADPSIKQGYHIYAERMQIRL